MKRIQRIAAPFLVVALLLGLIALRGASGALAQPQASATSFNFAFAADSRDGYSVLSAESRQMVTHSPLFGFFGGDLCGSFSTTCINNTWKPAMDGNNGDGMLAKTFVTRGNHDSGLLSSWQGLWDLSSMATRLGASHFTAPTSDATYSFDYGNSHFVVIDAPGGPNAWTSTEVSWFDSDLTAAEGRGIVHEFLFSHGPMYGVTSEHGSEAPSASLKAVLNKHPNLIGFHGHEHVTQYTHVTPSFESGITAYDEFTLGRAGAPAYSVVKTTTWHADQNAFANVVINGNSVTVTVYSQSGSSLYSKTFSHGGSAPTSTPGSPKPTATPGSGGASASATYISNASSDGYILETSETSGVGGTVNATSGSFRVGDDASNRQYRAILSFDTSGIPDNATITSVTLKIKQAGSGGANPYSSMGNLMGDVIAGPFSGNSALESADFQATANKNAALSIPNTPSSGWFSKSMGSAYFGFVNKAGVTQFRLHFATDDNNNKVADYLSFYTAETGTAANRPQLVVKYTVP